MDIEQQIRIPPPVQPDGLRPEPRVEREPIASSPSPAPHFVVQPGRFRTRLRKTHRRLSPLMIFVGYITSAGLGIGIGVLILKYIGLIDANWNIR